jgi:hypothetical protein
MKRMLLASTAALAMVCTVASAASGVLPKKSGVYVGEIKSSPFPMRVSIGVTPAGTAARVTYHCGTGRAPTTVFGMKIDPKGYFKFESNPATGQAWKLAGHFTSPTTAFVSLNSISCGGSKGSTTLKLKT